MADTAQASTSGIPDASQLVNRMKASGQLERLRALTMERLQQDVSCCRRGCS
jgi:hypothetical protein